MLVQWFRCVSHSINTFTLASAFLACSCRILVAGDYFLTIGGGYNPSGNQASLEENVIFFQHVLSEKDLAARPYDVFFADGDDKTPDLQVMASKLDDISKRPATELLASLHRRRGQEQVEYRNHRVPKVNGPLDPALVRASIESFAKKAHRGDRLVVYVTAHGSEGPEGDEFNTTIDCWDEQTITAREFSRWLDLVPSDVPTVMVMAQCYCGGFARTVFDDLDAKRGLSSRVRIGFFAQQHYLPAQGCRPDIEHDQEFSSYFWGAIVGRSRVGTPVTDCDIDGDGAVSFAEAYAYAVWAGETIDIPLTTTDVLLRTYSRMPETDVVPSAEGHALSGKLQSFVDLARANMGRIVAKLSPLLGFGPNDDASLVVAAYEKHLKNPPNPDAGRGGRRGSGSARRELLSEVSEKWPELGDRQKWERSRLLADDNQEKLLDELKQLPSWKAYEERRRQLDQTNDLSERHELREIKFRRLVKTLELILLDQNLPKVAAPEIVERYRQMVAIEDSTLGSGR